MLASPTSLGGQLARYGVVGGSNIALSTLLMMAMAYAGLLYPVYTTLVYGLGLVYSYHANRLLTFGGKPWSRKAFILFVVLNSAFLLFVQGVQYTLIEKLNWPEVWGVGLGMVLYVVLSFGTNKWVIFK